MTVFGNARPTLSGPHQTLLQTLRVVSVVAETGGAIVAGVSGGGVLRRWPALPGNNYLGGVRARRAYLHPPAPGHSLTLRPTTGAGLTLGKR